MSNISPRMRWSYPEDGQGNYYDTFEGMVLAMDASGYASREDRDIILCTEANILFIPATGVLSWDASINIISPITGFNLSIPAGSVVLQDGEFAYVYLVRGALSNQSLTVFSAPMLPNDDNAFSIGVRFGNAVYFKSGKSTLATPAGILYRETGDDLVLGDVVCIGTDGKLTKFDGSPTLAETIAGISVGTFLTGSMAVLAYEGSVSGFSGLTVGSAYYATGAGQIDLWENLTPEIITCRVGVAIAPTSLLVRLGISVPVAVEGEVS